MVTELAEGVWWIDLPGVNAYLVDDGAVTLVDAGSPRDADELADALEGVAGGVDAVDRVLVTHYDVDHVGGLGRLGLAAPVHVGEADAPYVAGTAKPPWTSRKGALQRLVGRFARPPSGPVEPVADGDRIGGFTAYHTPGHTSGHVVYVHEALSLACLGDLVRAEDGAYALPYWLFTGDGAKLRESVRELADRAPHFEIGAPGHGRPIESEAWARLESFADSLE